jgi:hypothetical protein
MKNILLLVPLVILMVSCNDQQRTIHLLQAKIDSLQKKTGGYKPGLGEFMSSIQVHHEKLWFAGINQNWKLADFEINEIKEAIEDIQNYCTDRPERTSLPMIDAPIDSISRAIQQNDETLFKMQFITLTNTCNNCHKATDHGFNVIKLPDSPPFSNQEFKPADSKK